jgi:DNA-binding transcriptional MerR regulator
MIDAIQDQLAKIPDKTYFRIGEVAKLVGVEPYVLRFWETEFKTMVPPKSRSKQRMYRRKDLETILVVKHLLYAERFTIEGARKRLLELQRAQKAGLVEPPREGCARARPAPEAAAALAGLSPREHREWRRCSAA